MDRSRGVNLPTKSSRDRIGLEQSTKTAMTLIPSGIDALGVSTVFLTAILLLTLPDKFITVLPGSFDLHRTHVQRSHLVSTELSPAEEQLSMICAAAVVVS